MEKDIQNQVADKKDSYAVEVLSRLVKDSKGIYLYRKAEKICKAFFMLTQHMPDSESIKARLRNAALDLVSQTLAFVSSSSSSGQPSDRIVLDAMSLISMSDMAASARMMSPGNRDIVLHQAELFLQDLEQFESSLMQASYPIPSSLFDMSEEEAASEVHDLKKDSDAHMSPPRAIHPVSDKKTAAKPIQPVQRPVQQKPFNAYAGPVLHLPKIGAIYKTENGYSNKPMPSADRPAQEGNASNRQHLIIETIRAKGELSIKDLTDVIKGCSEKTIQRELISLVNAGVLLKAGERRWSRYSIAQR